MTKGDEGTGKGIQGSSRRCWKAAARLRFAQLGGAHSLCKVLNPGCGPRLTHQDMPLLPPPPCTEEVPSERRGPTARGNPVGGSCSVGATGNRPAGQMHTLTDGEPPPFRGAPAGAGGRPGRTCRARRGEQRWARRGGHRPGRGAEPSRGFPLTGKWGAPPRSAARRGLPPSPRTPPSPACSPGGHPAPQRAVWPHGLYLRGIPGYSGLGLSGLAFLGLRAPVLLARGSGGGCQPQVAGGRWERG